MLFDGYMPVRIVSGAGCLKNRGKDLSRFGSSCLIVCSGTAAGKSGALDDCIEVLEQQGIAYDVFDEITENPRTATVHDAGRLARSVNASFIVGIGGGSPMDAAKAVAIYAANPEMTPDGIYARPIPCMALPVVLIGTTAGTGSEVTGVSVLTNLSGRKKSISGPDCYAALSFCDYRYSVTAPPHITFSTALDAFAHAVESILCSTSNMRSTLYAEQAIRLLRPYILAVEAENHPLTDEMYEALYAASIFAGLAINITGTAFPHTVGYYLTENYHVPHGLACAVFLPCLLEKAKKYCPEKCGAIEKQLGISSEVLSAKLRNAINLGISIPTEEAQDAAQRWKDGVANFNRSPGGFTYIDAADALADF